uniref:Astacin domain-containing protein n=1 Tax=Parastrongyloides trichosuri TaxID=131310 RepID=A0A0N4ZM14_PARTI
MSNARYQSRSRPLNIPYMLTGITKCFNSLKPNVKIELKYPNRLFPFFNTFVSRNFTNNEGNFTINSNIPDDKRKSARLYFYHNCDASGGARYPYAKLYSRYVKDSNCRWYGTIGGLRCDFGIINLENKCDEYKYQGNSGWQSCEN